MLCQQEDFSYRFFRTSDNTCMYSDSACSSIQLYTNDAGWFAR
jgi:hypothetical protein